MILSQEQLKVLYEWRDQPGVDFWSAGAAGHISRIMMPPKLQNTFETFLKRTGLTFEVVVEDVGEIEAEFEVERVRRLNIKKERSSIDPTASPNFKVYWTSDEINQYGVRLANKYPQFVTREVIARSFEGRDIFALKISSGGFGRKPIIFMDGGMHAREWVSQATVTYFLHRLIEDPKVRMELLENVDWIIIPNLNPDGYAWAHTKDRFWRQNRRVINETCLGVDLNRNFRYSWRAPNPGTVSLYL